MCTVTFIKLNNTDFILTSNRDEQVTRETIPPTIYQENGVNLLFPKDRLAGGTWIGTSSQNRLVCLLNGAFKNHKKLKKYKFSRGIIVKQALLTEKINPFVEEFDFSKIEPFTLIIVDWNKEVTLYELIWDGNKKYFNALKDEKKIWSSATLYDDSMKKLRNKWFLNWNKKNTTVNQQKVLKFHHSHFGDDGTSILMRRPSIQTVSITSVLKKEKSITMTYEDVLTNSTVSKSLN